MSRIRDTVVTNCEKSFVCKALKEHKRLNGRSFDEFRPSSIQFGRDWGSATVTLGKTSVLVQTTCEIQAPKASRPSEGTLTINVELGPLAAPHFEPGRQSDESIRLNRILEKCFKDSKTVDLESLCIKTSEKVWCLRVDVNVLNHEGNILDCAGVAVLTSLVHFRRPDVTCDGENFIIHEARSRDFIPTVVHHYPVCVTYSVFNEGDVILADADLLEETIADASLSICVNGFRELCGLHLTGTAQMTPGAILKTVKKTTTRAEKLIQIIKGAVKSDVELRTTQFPPKTIGFTSDSFSFSAVENAPEGLETCLDRYWSTTSNTQRKRIKRKHAKQQQDQEKSVQPKAEPNRNIKSENRGTAIFIPKPEVEEEDVDDVMIVETKEEMMVISSSEDGGSEEDDVIVLDKIMS